ATWLTRSGIALIPEVRNLFRDSRVRSIDSLDLSFSLAPTLLTRIHRENPMSPSRRSQLMLRPLEERTVPVAGALDPSFGVDGIAAFHTSQFSHDLGNDVLIQPDGKIVVAGNAEAFASNPWPLLARLNTDGSLDSSFAGEGTAIVTVPNSSSGGFSKVLRQPDGKFVAVGT